MAILKGLGFALSQRMTILNKTHFSFKNYILALSLILSSLSAFSATKSQCVRLFKDQTTAVDASAIYNFKPPVKKIDIREITLAQAIKLNPNVDKAIIERALKIAQDFSQLKQIRNKEGVKGISKLLRSNAPQFWATALILGGQYFPPELLKFVGLIIGDPHNGNIGQVEVHDKVIDTLVDYDDPDRGPFILDITKFIAALKTVTKDISGKEDIWPAYIDGLNQVQRSPPDFIQKVLSLTPDEFREKEVKKASRFSNKDNLIKDGDRSSQINDPKLEKAVKTLLAKSLPNLEILDVGGRTKASGGSADAERFLALVKGEDGQNTLYELKENLEPAVSIYTGEQKYTRQDVMNTLFNRIVNGKRDPRYQEVELKIDGQLRKFTLRPKQLYFSDFANEVDKKNVGLFVEMSLYNAYIIGGIHGKQNPEYVKVINESSRMKDADPVYENVRSFFKMYYRLLESELSK